ncbi:MAG: FecR domain-containing protein [Massilibacteroides sp.]|nr:FecR domain-containing protein [Massilibacteroides sp.]
MTIKNANKDTPSEINWKIKIDPKVEQEGEKLKNRLFFSLMNRIQQEQDAHTYFRQFAVAASIAVLFVLGLNFAYQKGYTQRNSQWIEVKSPMGTITQVTLPDGTNVTLNAGTSLHYPSLFTKKLRNVEVNGEAYFEVTHDVTHPFIVKASEIYVRVKGTTFNVQNYADEKKVSVALVQGKVSLGTTKKASILDMDPGTEVIYDKMTQTMSKRHISLYQRTAWRDGKFFFENCTLQEIARQFERAFNKHIILKPKTLGNIEFTGEFVNHESPRQILRVLSADRRISYSIKGDIITISKTTK